MNTYVHLNDIFNITTPAVMEMRVDYAFGTDGANFWQNFFSYDIAHENDRVIYLFTEYQLEFLWRWLDIKLKTNDDNIRLNLEYSRQKMFNTVKTAQDEKMADQIRVGYINWHESMLKIQRVFFGVPPNKKMKMRYNDFFFRKIQGRTGG